MKLKPKFRKGGVSLRNIETAKIVIPKDGTTFCLQDRFSELFLCESGGRCFWGAFEDKFVVIKSNIEELLEYYKSTDIIRTIFNGELHG